MSENNDDDDKSEFDFDVTPTQTKLNLANHLLELKQSCADQRQRLDILEARMELLEQQVQDDDMVTRERLKKTVRELEDIKEAYNIIAKALKLTE